MLYANDLYSCHPAQLHNRLLCQKPCRRKLACGHHCERLCHEPCGACVAIVLIPMPCGHVNEMRCSDLMDDTPKCTYINRSIQLGCGHQYSLFCSSSLTGDPKCDGPCTEVLPCGHNCPGKCQDCHGVSTHLSCTSPCGKDLPCSHKCTQM
jgi:hypothetical protein